MLIRDIAQILQANGIGVLGTDIFLGQLPASPDNVVAVFQYAGRPRECHSALKYPGLQIYVRNKQYTSGYNLISSIVNLLHGTHEVITAENHYLLIKALEEPYKLDTDENGRHIFTCRFEVMQE